MTRKRFIKLAMAHGYDRNHAETIATRVKDYGTYESLYNVLYVVANAGDIASTITKGLVNAFKVLGKAIQAAGVALIQFAEQLNKGR